MDEIKLIERSIIKKYRREIWLRFVSAVIEYELICPNDRIAVCISGGKDSMLLAKCMQELKRHNKIPFELVFLVMDPGYSPENRQIIEENASKLGIPIDIFSSSIYDIVFDAGDSPCYLCARMRRGHLYSRARALGCNKIALGHHFDDAVETVLMSMLYSGEIQTMLPKLHSANFPGMELIRPMYHVREEDIRRWARYNGLHFLRCACRFTEKCSPDDAGSGKRAEMKALVRQFRQTSPVIDVNIFNSVKNVNLEGVLGWRAGGGRHSFLDDYEARGKGKQQQQE